MHIDRPCPLIHTLQCMCTNTQTLSHTLTHTRFLPAQGYILGLGCNLPTTCNATRVAEVQQYASDLKGTVEAAQSSFANRDGRFLTSCVGPLACVCAVVCAIASEHSSLFLRVTCLFHPWRPSLRSGCVRACVDSSLCLGVMHDDLSWRPLFVFIPPSVCTSMRRPQCIRACAQVLSA